MTVGTLPARQAAVLEAVVANHIRTGEPVGSGTIASRHRLGVSPATIRNDMASLEDGGYLRQPHTSAGRVPTDLGFRHYVDAMPRWPRLPTRHRRVVAEYFGARGDTEEMVRGTAGLLSRLTRYGAVVQPPSSDHVFLGGTANIVGEDIFAERSTVRGLLEALEEERQVLELLTRLIRDEDVAVRIGHENPMRAMQEASLVAAAYGRGSRAIGVIAVIGPTRMHYEEAIPAVRMVSRHLSLTVDAW